MVYNTDFYTNNPHIQIETVYPSVNYFLNDFVSNSVVYGYNGKEENELTAIEYAFNTDLLDKRGFLTGYSHVLQVTVIFNYFVLSFIKTY